MSLRSKILFLVFLLSIATYSLLIGFESFFVSKLIDERKQVFAQAIYEESLVRKREVEFLIERAFQDTQQELRSLLEDCSIEEKGLKLTDSSLGALFLLHPHLDFIQGKQARETLTLIPPRPLYLEEDSLFVGEKHPWVKVEYTLPAENSPYYLLFEPIQENGVISSLKEPPLFFQYPSLFEPTSRWLSSLLPHLMEQASEISKETSPANLEQRGKHRSFSTQKDPKLVWQLSLLRTHSSFFSKNPLFKGIARKDDSKSAYLILLSDSLFNPSPLTPLLSLDELDVSTLNLYREDKSKTLFIGLQKEFSSLSLTLGIDFKNFLKKIPLQEKEMLIVEASGYLLQESQEESAPSISPKEYTQIKEHLSGNFKDQQGREYLFMKINPKMDLGLDFFILQPWPKEFVLVEFLASTLRTLSKSLMLHFSCFALFLSVVLFVALSCLLKKVFKPLSILMEATVPLGEGNFSIELPSLKETPGEVSELYHRFQKMIEQLREHSNATAVLHKVLDPAVSSALLKNPSCLEGKELTATILFLDFRSFTHKTESMAARDVILLINEYMKRISAIIEKHRGVIDKYIGDAVMAVWGIEGDEIQAPLQAVRAAIEIQEMMERYNQERSSLQQLALEAGIGIHTANVFMGLMGGEHHKNFTVIGSSVNIASRVTGIAKGGDVLVTSQVFEATAAFIPFIPLGRVTLEGLTMPHQLYKWDKQNGG